MKYRLIVKCAIGALLFSACGGNEVGKSKGAIVLGDSATIITEKDSQYLRDDVLDMEPMQQVAPPPQTRPAKDTTKPLGATTAVPVENNQSEEKGFVVDFGNVKMILAGLQANDARKQNAKQDAGLTYVLKSNDISVGNVVFRGVKDVTVKQRYQSKLILRSSLGTVDLRTLGLYTSEWKTLNGKNSADAESFALNTLNNLSYSSVNNNKITNAVDKELRKRRTSSKVIQSWMKDVKRIRSTKDKPCEILLDNVQWQVSGTDSKGKSFQKTIRIDA